MTTAYPGPVRHEPLALELHNTLYAVRGELIDGLETTDDLSSWLAAITHRLPAQARDADASRLPEFLALREAVRGALVATLEGEQVEPAVLGPINAAAAAAPSSLRAVADEGAGGRVRAETRYHAADPTDVALAALARDAIGMMAGPGRERLRACLAPGCVLLFSKDHPRRRWCSTTCGNRARQARHYERVRRARQ
jgi:predicted RNA-binding Zn ribbon-like protein